MSVDPSSGVVALAMPVSTCGAHDASDPASTRPAIHRKGDIAYYKVQYQGTRSTGGGGGGRDETCLAEDAGRDLRGGKGVTRLKTVSREPLPGNYQVGCLPLR